MKRLAIAAMAILLLTIPVHGVELPQAKGEVATVVPKEADSFLEGFWTVLKACMEELDPALQEAGQVCLKVSGVVLLCSMVKGFGGANSGGAMELAAAAAVGGVLLMPSASLIQLGEETVRSLSEYSKLLLPVMTSAMAAQGGTVTSASLYAVTALLDSLISSALSDLILPLIYLYLGLALANAAVGEAILGKLKEFCKWLITWILKTALYIFTGFLSVTGVVSGSADAAAIKAAKITISGAVPVVGSILSDASEAVLVGAGVMRNAAGVYGLLTICGLFLTPFFRIGVQYVLLKGTGALCASLGEGRIPKLIMDFAGAMGLIVAVTAVQTVLLMVSTVCFMKGLG